MRLGFTGTREGLTAPQLVALEKWFDAHAADVSEFHHGCCVGSDEAAASIATGFEPVRVVAHPPVYDYALSRKSLLFSDVELPKAHYDERNRAIVDACDVLLATPRAMAEEWRSGTWATTRYARKRKKRIVIFWPDGTVTEENPHP